MSRGVLTADAYAVWRLPQGSTKWRIEVAHGLSAAFCSEQVEETHGNQLQQPVVFEVHSASASPMMDGRRKSLAQEGIRAMAAVPLFLNGQAQGTIAFYFRSEHTFSSEELDLMQTVANIAGAALDNAQLFAAEAETARRARLLAKVSGIFSSSLNFDTTMQAVVNAVAAELSDWCSVWLYDGKQLERGAVAHWNPDKLAIARELAEKYPPDLEDSRSLLTLALRTLTPQMAADIKDEALALSAQDDRHLELLRAAEISSLIVIPLVLAGQASGALMLVSSSRRPALNEKDMELAQQVADRAAAAIENARLYREQQSIAAQLKRLNEAGRKLAAELNESRLLQAMTDAAAQGSGAEAAAFVAGAGSGPGEEASAQPDTVFAAHGWSAAELLLPRSRVFLDQVLSNRESVRIDDVTSDLRYLQQSPSAASEPAGLRSYLAVPVIGSDGTVFGGLLLGHRQPRAFTTEHESYVEALSSQAAAALANAALYRRAQDEILRRTRTEAALHREQQFLALAQKAAHVGSWDVDLRTPDGLVTWSPELQVMYGLEPGSFDGRLQSWKDALHPEDHDPTVAALEQAILNQQQWDAEFRIVRPDGSVRWLAGRGHAIYDQHGQPKNMIGINIDITERRLSEEAMRRSERLVTAGRMAATVAHEINNPLEAVTNLLYLAQTGTREPTLLRLLTSADQELRRVAHIARQTLGFYRDHSSSAGFDIAEEVEQVLSILKRQLANRGVLVHKRLRPVTVEAVQGEIRQVISNLVTNAADASQAGSFISLRTAPARLRSVDGDLVAAVSITVADRGHGMTHEVRRRIFEPFFTTKKDVGTGLGLWVTKEIVDRHAGHLRLRSAVGKGSVFAILLPLRSESGKRREDPIRGTNMNSDLLDPER